MFSVGVAVYRVVNRDGQGHLAGSAFRPKF
jgi:hypothetical protein